MTASSTSAFLPCLWVTRPKEDAAAFADEIENLGYQTLQVPLLNVVKLEESLKHVDVTQYNGVIITSLNGLRSIAPYRTELASMPLWVVGKHLEAEAALMGYQDIICCGGDVKTLIDFMIHHVDKTDKLLYLSPKEPSKDVAAVFLEAGYQVDSCIVYYTKKVKKLSEVEQLKLKELPMKGVILLSVKTAQAYVNIIKHYRLQEHVKDFIHFCLSDVIADALKASPALALDKVVVSSQPNRQSLLAKIAEFKFT